MKSRALLFLTACLLVAAGAFSFGQRPEAGPTKREQVIRVTTRLIEVNVVATDSKDHAVTDLTRDDFSLFVNGKRVPIDVFSSVSAEPGRSAPRLPPNTYSNRLGRPGEFPSVTVILLDGLNTTFEDQTWARSEVVQFLEKLEPTDRVAIYLLGERLWVAQDFTSDPKLLLEVLKKTIARPSKELAASASAEPTPGAAEPVDVGAALGQTSTTAPTGAGPGGSGPSTNAIRGASATNSQAQEEAVFRQFEEHESARFVLDRVSRTVDALIAIAHHLAEFPGRKNLIWVSGSFPISVGFEQPRAPGDTRDQVHFAAELRRASQALNNADIAVYPVDARGLIAGGAAGGLTSVSGRGPAGGMLVNADTIYSTQGTMDELANHTGGRAFYNSNDLSGIIRRALDDSRADYTLGFYPHHQWDGSYHELKLKVDRPGVHLRYRQGYYASLVPSSNEGDPKAALSEVISSPLDATGLGLTVRVEKIPAGPEKRVTLHITLDARNLTFLDKNGDKLVVLEMVFAQSGPDGKTLNAFRQTVNMRLAAQGMDVILNRGLTVGKWVGLVDGATELELVVRDTASGNLGSVRIPLGA